jgi:hypothetical protein
MVGGGIGSSSVCEVLSRVTESASLPRRSYNDHSLYDARVHGGSRKPFIVNVATLFFRRAVSWFRQPANRLREVFERGSMWAVLASFDTFAQAGCAAWCRRRCRRDDDWGRGSHEILLGRWLGLPPNRYVAHHISIPLSIRYVLHSWCWGILGFFAPVAISNP